MKNYHATIIINRNDSQCANCGKGADYREDSHQTTFSWEGTSLGCGVKWENVTSSYGGMEDVVKSIRPDLKYVEFIEVYKLRSNWIDQGINDLPGWFS